jgi:tetratricopeptide (TPR) repeat protein
MARSIHQTHRELSEAQRAKDADAERIERVREALRQKRRIKSQIKSERRETVPPLPAIAPETIPIRVIETCEFIHYPASPADLLAVMQALPEGVLNGLREIALCVGKEYQREAAEDDGGEADPLIGRCGSESIPGVFQGRVLGTYWRRQARIHLYAYVYQPQLPEREMWEFWLRLKMLSTFTHEIAHHHDQRTRVARGRWLMEPEAKAESYAEKMEHQWTQQYVVPYLKQKYRRAWRAFQRWLEQHGGTVLPLTQLAGDPRVTVRQGKLTLFSMTNSVWSVPNAVKYLAEAVAAGNEAVSTRLQFARDLHYGEHYEDALRIIARVLAEAPSLREALILRADIYVHQERFDEALILAGHFVALDETDFEAWKILADSFEGKESWRELARTAARLVELAETRQDKHARRMALRQRALARIGIGDFADASADIEELSQESLSFTRRQVDRLKTELAARQSLAQPDR